MCSNEATSDEHVPPRCFFPKLKDLPTGVNYRKDLITVPSCDSHNSEKSKDDEYLRMVVVSHYENNLVAQRHFSKKIMRSIARRPSLLGIIKEPRPAMVEGKSTGAFTVDRARFDRAMDCIVRALYYNDTKKKWIEPITIQTPALFPIEREDYKEIYRNIQHIGLMADKIFETSPRIGSNQEIFYYQIYCVEQLRRLLVKMVFYEGYIVVAYSSPTINWLQEN